MRYFDEVAPLLLARVYLILEKLVIVRRQYKPPFCFCRVTGGELFEDIVAREYYSEADAR